jgi:hypothetical protein
VDVKVNDRSEADEAHSRLEEGLKCCRSLIRNYRSLMTGSGSSPPAGASSLEYNNAEAIDPPAR